MNNPVPGSPGRTRSPRASWHPTRPSRSWKHPQLAVSRCSRSHGWSSRRDILFFHKRYRRSYQSNHILRSGSGKDGGFRDRLIKTQTHFGGGRGVAPFGYMSPCSSIRRTDEPRWLRWRRQPRQLTSGKYGASNRARSRPDHRSIGRSMCICHSHRRNRGLG